MPAGVIYPDRMDAEKYAHKVRGTIVPVSGGYAVRSGRGPMGRVVDELGYQQGGRSAFPRGPIRYSKGGAVKGKDFKGTF